MPKEVQLWKIESGDRLREIPLGRLDLESRIEAWLAADIGRLEPGLLVIGQQVNTDYGGTIDLLCIDSDGTLVIVELKRDRTPREITAQVIDYASWVNELSAERVNEIAAAHLKPTTLEDAFRERFETELPETVNADHRMLIVGSNIDPASERIVRYLSEEHGVNINAATFQYFKDRDGVELLSRVFLLKPAEVELQSRTKGTSKRRPNLTTDELDAQAREQGVPDLYRYAVDALAAQFTKHTTRSSICFTSELDAQKKAVISLLPSKSKPDEGLAFQIYFERFQKLFGLSEAQAMSRLPANRERWIYYPGAGDDFAGFQGHFANTAEINHLVAGLS